MATGPRGLASTLVERLRLRTAADRYGMQVLRALGNPPLEEDGASSTALSTSVVGLDPIRVLLFGGSFAVGYGTPARASALDHVLAQRVAALTGRGVTVRNRAKRHVSLPEVVPSLGAVGTHTYHVAVWCPTFIETTRRLSIRSWRVELHAMIRGLRDERAVPLVLVQMPYAAGRNPVALLLRPWMQRIGAVIDQVAQEYDDVEVVPAPPLTADAPGEVRIEAAYYRALADDVAEAVAGLLTHRRAAPAAASARVGE